jgi:hypothetical protein
MSEPEPTEVVPTMSPPIIPMTTVATGRAVRSWTTPWRVCPWRRSRAKRRIMPAAPMS